MSSLINDKFEYKIYSGVLTKNECNNLISQCTDFKVSQTINDLEKEEKTYRKALTAVFTTEPFYITKLRNYFAQVTNTKVGQQETPISIVKYSEGDYYLPHLDAFGGVGDITHPEAGDRLITGIAYLNDDYTGGETLFNSQDIKVKGTQGDLLVWRNLNKDGSPNKNTLHSGQPITKGSKYIAVIWAREHELNSFTEKTLF